jgi:hypothetical protein
MKKDNKKNPYVIPAVAVGILVLIVLIVRGTFSAGLFVNIIWWGLIIYSIYKSEKRKQKKWTWALIINLAVGFSFPIVLSSILPILYLFMYRGKEEIKKR